MRTKAWAPLATEGRANVLGAILVPEVTERIDKTREYLELLRSRVQGLIEREGSYLEALALTTQILQEAGWMHHIDLGSVEDDPQGLAQALTVDNYELRAKLEALEVLELPILVSRNDLEAQRLIEQTDLAEWLRTMTYEPRE